ncbi:alpha/beta hydrolase [Luteolibacter sp. GHJ8]|uniref:Alpha/beta hydrolase n=1 Tax=Luteolibacter rhizosphaerae TaxID=2989719 RepID=A0ABT3G8G4_9BACT|nr:alpha/beta hydrolase [Luteolibacter rhizosphaerae]MCW1915879.1 alpha/beta hydrolase [Luteolibacter rhizosphaerae]
MNSKIIFIHGMFQNPKSWREWVSFFEATGFEALAPAWPLHEGEPSDIRANIPAGLGNLTLAEVYGHFHTLAAAEPEPPVVIGHSLGGLVAQKLLADGLVRAAVGIASVAPNKMLALDWGFLRNSASITNPFAGNDPYEMTPELFHRNFANALSRTDSDAAWEAYAVHESRQVMRDILGSDGEIDLSLPHNPLLLIGAEKDEIIPAPLVRRNAHAYEDERSHHEYKEFNGRGHFICGEPGWDEVAVSVSNWLEGHLSAIRA